jgi:hypothetical protein
MEGLRILCDELTTIVLMDENTRDGFKCGFPSVVFPEPYMFVVPTHVKQGSPQGQERAKSRGTPSCSRPCVHRLQNDHRISLLSSYLVVQGEPPPVRTPITG